MNSTTNYQPYTNLTGEKPVVTDANEDYVLEQLRLEIQQIKTEIGQAENKGLAGKLGFKKPPKNAIISGDNNRENTSSMTEILQPSSDLTEALKLALDAVPVGDLNTIVFEQGRNEKDQTQNRVGDALAARANALSATAPEAEVVRGGYTKVANAENMFMAIDAVRGYGREVEQARHAVAGKEIA